jgi:hypothetical protein
MKFSIRNSKGEVDERETHINAGRMYRLFNRGHATEPRILEWLIGIGCQVWALDSNGEQYHVQGVHGHFGGSLDGICKLPPEYGIDELVLLEFKTNGSHKAWESLLEDGMQKAKPQHYAQMNCYGCDPNYNFKYCLYIVVNKSDDEMYLELVPLNQNVRNSMLAKAEHIIVSQEPPQRLSDDPTYWKCKYCDAHNICHKNELPERNCRSCINAQPTDNAEWLCNAHKSVIPKEFIPQACSSYQAITQIRRK